MIKTVWLTATDSSPGAAAEVRDANELKTTARAESWGGPLGVFCRRISANFP
jgi:hypothetical protein